jgi:hypothetical protein
MVPCQEHAGGTGVKIFRRKNSNLKPEFLNISQKNLPDFDLVWNYKPEGEYTFFNRLIGFFLGNCYTNIYYARTGVFK